MRLFTEFFELGLEGDDFAGNDGVIGLGADGVDFAVHFLGEKIEGAAHGFAGFAAILELMKMALQPGQFLGDVRAVGKEDDFLEQALVIRGNALQPGAFDALQQLAAVVSAVWGACF